MVLPPLAIVWRCPLAVEQYAEEGKAIAAARPGCPDCGTPLRFRSGYWCHVRSGGGTGRPVWIVEPSASLVGAPGGGRGRRGPPHDPGPVGGAAVVDEFSDGLGLALRGHPGRPAHPGPPACAWESSLPSISGSPPATTSSPWTWPSRWPTFAITSTSWDATSRSSPMTPWPACTGSPTAFPRALNNAATAADLNAYTHHALNCRKRQHPLADSWVVDTRHRRLPPPSKASTVRLLSRRRPSIGDGCVVLRRAGRIES